VGHTPLRCITRQDEPVRNISTRSSGWRYAADVTSGLRVIQRRPKNSASLQQDLTQMEKKTDYHRKQALWFWSNTWSHPLHVSTILKHLVDEKKHYQQKYWARHHVIKKAVRILQYEQLIADEQVRGLYRMLESPDEENVYTALMILATLKPEKFLSYEQK
jgi:hypothetical protein